MNEDKPSARGERRDPASPEPLKEQIGTHPLGTAGGAVAGATAGAVAGLAAGPIGSLAGAVAGAVLGGAAGASTGGVSDFDYTPHEAWWREHHATRQYVPPGAAYDDYASAYRYGTLAYARTDHPKQWDEVEAELEAGWNEARGTSRLKWTEAKAAVRDAWERMLEPQRAESPGSVYRAP